MFPEVGAMSGFIQNGFQSVSGHGKWGAGN